MFVHFVWFIVTLTVKAREIHALADGPEIQLLNVDKVWNKGLTGSGIAVAVVDNGVVKCHHDLRDNYNASLSFNFVKPTTRQATSHGTKCAGLIAGKLHGTCRNAGIAYNAQLANLKILNGSIAHDVPTAKALGYKKQEIDIYSNSWGPSDSGHLVHGPGPLVKEALKQGTKSGRSGRGSIFVFSTGNGGGFQDSCAFDGYINSIYTIGIGAVTKFRKTPYYAEPCSSVMAAAYGDDVKTCDTGRCVNNFGRTSAAAAMASGILALLLEATKNTLTWRDVHHLIVRTSRPNREFNDGNNWIVNGAGLLVNPFIGFGIMDADKLVEVAAQNWPTVPHQKSCTISFKLTKPLQFNSRRNSFVIYTNRNESCSKINHIEQVQVEISTSFERRGKLEMYLESPYQTKSKLIYERMYDAITGRRTFNNLPVTSLHFWGESVKAHGGKWKISFESSLNLFRIGRIGGKLSKFKITFYGTDEDPIKKSGLPKGIKLCKYGNGVANFWTAYGEKCCGSLGLYDENRAKCCNGQKIVQKDQFCGRRKYDQCTEICCGGIIHPKVEGAICCGRKTYDTKTQICCNSIPVAKFKCKKVWYRRHSYLRRARAVCSYYGIYYSPEHNKRCPDPCAGDPCRNRGRCVANIEKFTFTCEDPCAGDPCRNRGRCVANIEKFTFTCEGDAFLGCVDKTLKKNCELGKRMGYCSYNGFKHTCPKTCGHCR